MCQMSGINWSANSSADTRGEVSMAPKRRLRGKFWPAVRTRIWEKAYELHAKEFQCQSRGEHNTADQERTKGRRLLLSGEALGAQGSQEDEKRRE